jgi:hypothetical protein
VNIDLQLLTGQPCEMAALQKVLEGAPTYAERLTGHPPGAAEAQRLFSALLPEITHDNKVEAKVRRWPEIDMLRTSMVRSNATVLPFWQRMGFAETGEVQPYVCDEIVSESVILTRPLHDDDHPRDPAS